jgi:hypothetical protein
MADLIDRISGESVPDRPKINWHYFMGLERYYAMGVYTRGQIAAALDLQGDELTQATQLADNIDAQVGLDAKLVYLARVESAGMMMEEHQDTLIHDAGAVDKAAVYALLQIAG